MPNYVPLDVERLKQVVEKEMAFREVSINGCGERVWERRIVTKSGQSFPYRIVIYSSIDKNSEHSREVGEDAIRLVIIDEETGRPVAKAIRTHRTKNAIENTRIKARDLFKTVITSKTCPKCSSIMVERTNKKDGGVFWGCSRYSAPEPYRCRATTNH
jgi:hypothetical protein